MRLTLTVVDPVRDAHADVLLDADPDTPVGSIVRALSAQVRPEVRRRRPAARLGPVPAAAGGDPLAGGPASDGGFTPLAQLAPDPRPPRPRVWGEGSWPADTRAADGTGSGWADGEVVAFVAGSPVHPALSLAESPLREGTVVSLDSPAGCLPPEPTGTAELRVTGGPGAGIVHRLGPGEYTVGSEASCTVVVTDPLCPGQALTVTVALDGSARLTPWPGVEVLVDGEPLIPGTAAVPGAAIAVGSVLLDVCPPSRPDAAVRSSDDGAGLDVNRPPRLLPPLRKTHFRLPSEPAEPERRPMPVLMLMLPAVAGVTMAVLLQIYYFLLFALISPLSLIGSHVTGNRQARRTYRRQLGEYRRRRDEVHTDAQDALAAERTARRADHPDPASVLLTAVGPRRRLWERRREDPDYLHFRLGTADLPSEVVLEDPAAAEHKRQTSWTAPDVPVTVALAERGVLGVAGRGELPQVLGCWLVAQAAVLHSPRNLTIYVLTGSAGERAWNWVRWLPHCRPSGGQDTAVLLGTDDESRARRAGELVTIVAARAATRSGGRSTDAVLDDPDVLVVLDGARAMRSIPGMISVLRDGPAVGVRSICLDHDVRLLPEECHAVAEQTPGGLRVTQMRSDVVSDVRPDLVGTAAVLDVDGPVADDHVDVGAAAAWCERLARALAPLRDVADDDDASIPSSARLLDVLELEPPTAAAIGARWSLSAGSTAFPIGVSLDGPFALDLRRDGPHGLIAGTTGAGKSELLQSIVASLAVLNRPDAMTFVLVDYKGGSAFADCVTLPHTVGMVTDLDTHLVQRALTSLGAELRRREHILAAAGAKDIEDYTVLAARGGGGTGARLGPLPRLLLVIDEFASLARELPDFVSGLVNIAQRGRSLGIHLLLATQRPSGVVSAEIRANTNLRIALRVTDASESADVINAPDAARISKATPGRAFARLGHSSLVPFQTGRVGGRRPATAHSPRPAIPTAAPWVAELTWPALGRPAPAPPGPAGSTGAATDLRVLVAAVKEATSTAGIPAQHSPWLPPLPDQVMIADLPAAVPTPGSPGSTGLTGSTGSTGARAGHVGRVAPVPIGLSDYCDRQAQLPFTVDIENGGHLMFVGSPRSGRSTALRTLAGAVAATTGSSQVHIYGLDCGNNALAPLVTLPHTGAVVSRDSAERVQRLFTRLIGEVAARQEAFSAKGYADLAEQRDAEGDGGLPYMLLLLDRFEGFLAAFENVDGGIMVDALMRLLREGPAVGLRVIMTTDRRGLSGRLSSAIEDRFVLRLAEKGDYTMVGLPSSAVPDGLAPGRGFRVDGVVETQLALLDPDPSGRAQVAALNALATRAAERDGVPPGPASGPRNDHRRPFRIDVLPARIGLTGAVALRDPLAPTSPTTAVIGVGGDELAAIEVDLEADGPGFVIAGPPRSGRSSTLLTIATTLLDRGGRLALVLPRRSPLSALSGAPGVAAVLDASARSDVIDPLLASVADEGPLVIVMDDAELLADAPIAAKMVEFLRSARDSGSCLVAAGTTEDLTGQFRGFMVDARRSRCGLLLAPGAPAEGELFGVRLSRAVGGTVPPGRGLLFRRGKTTPIQVAAPA